MPLSNFTQAQSFAKSTLGGSIGAFMAKAMNNKDHEVSRSNLWYFDMSFPAIMRGKFPETALRSLLSLYCNEVNTPTRQITTAGAKVVGSEYLYATGSAFTETSVQFYIPRSHLLPTYFERWMNIMANDANSYVDYYDSYVSPTMTIYKLERGAGGEIPLDKEYLAKAGLTRKDILNKPRYNDFVGMWTMYNVFPKAISTSQFNNQTGNVVTLDVTFCYERYRFVPNPKFDMNSGPGTTLTLGKTKIKL